MYNGKRKGIDGIVDFNLFLNKSLFYFCDYA